MNYASQTLKNFPLIKFRYILFTTKYICVPVIVKKYTNITPTKTTKTTFQRDKLILRFALEMLYKSFFFTSVVLKFK